MKVVTNAENPGKIPTVKVIRRAHRPATKRVANR
jgi:hypothetical protein